MTSADSTATTELLRLDTYPTTVVFLHEAFAHRHDFIVDIKDVGIVVDWAAVANMSSTEAAMIDAVRALRRFETEGTGGPLADEFRRYLTQLFATPAQLEYDQTPELRDLLARADASGTVRKRRRRAE